MFEFKCVQSWGKTDLWLAAPNGCFGTTKMFESVLIFTELDKIGQNFLKIINYFDVKIIQWGLEYKTCSECIWNLNIPYSSPHCIYSQVVGLVILTKWNTDDLNNWLF